MVRRGIEGRYLPDDVTEALNSFLLERGFNGIPNITSIHLREDSIKQNFLNQIDQILDILRYPNIGLNLL